MARPLIAILYSDDDWKATQPFRDLEKRRCYEDLYQVAEEYGCTLVRTCLSWYRHGKSSRFWSFQHGQWRKHLKSIRPGLLIDKTRFSWADVPHKQEFSARYPMLNPWEIDCIASDKLLTTLLFPEYSAPTFLVRNHLDLSKALSHIRSRIVVLKPRIGSGGRGVQILSRKKAASVPIRESMIVQPLIDTSAGVPGVYRGVHDFRIVIIGQKPVIAYVRTPAKGKLLSNLYQGGSFFPVSVSRIPHSAKRLAREVCASFQMFPYKALLIDIFFVNGKPILNEINSKIDVVTTPEWRNVQHLVNRRTIEYCLSILR